MLHQTMQSQNNLGYFRIILNDLRGETLMLDLIDSQGCTITVKGANEGDHLIDLHGRKYDYTEYQVVEIY